MVGADELIAEAELAAEVEGRALLGEEGVRAAFDEEAFAGVGDDLSAEVVGGFEQKIVGVRAFDFWRAYAAARPEIPPPMTTVFGITLSAFGQHC